MLKQAGSDLSRENTAKAATKLTSTTKLAMVVLSIEVSR